MGHIEGGQTFAAREHIAHPFHLGGVELGQVERGQRFAV